MPTATLMPPVPSRAPVPGLRAVLRHQGRTSAWLAGRLGVVRPRISDWMRGARMPRTDVAERIADILGVPVAVLYLAEPQERAS